MMRDMTERSGIIYKGIAGVYAVYFEDGSTAEASACGRFRNEQVTPMVGDRVALEAPEEQGGTSWRITEIFPRKNQLIRPAMANVSTLVIVLAPAKPEPDLLMTDQLICNCRHTAIRPLLCINKSDIDPAVAELLQAEYNAGGIETLVTCADRREGLERLSEALGDGLNCFCGQSAVGKSSLLNLLLPERMLETGGLSKKTDRGKHTTRHSEIMRMPDGKLVADTPGFSLLGTLELPPEDLLDCYEEYAPYAPHCRFRDCVHTGQADCAVLEAVKAGKLPQGRYDRYVTIYKEMQEKWRKRYD